MLEKTVQHGLLVAVTTLIICVLGVVAATSIPVQMIPDLDVRTISVRTVWPGATPQDIEKEILIEQEEYLKTLPNLSRIETSARSGQAEVELDFPFGTDVTDMLIRVNNALSQVPSYPENVDEPRIYANSFSSNSFMFFYILPLPGNPRQIDIDLMRDFVEDNVKPLISRVPGISEANIWGGTERQIQILVDPNRLAQRNLSLLDVRNAIRARNRDQSGGEINSGKRQYLLRTVGRFTDLAALSNLIIAREGNAITRLKDVATVQMDHFEKRASSALNGEPNLFIALKREPGSNVIDIKQAIMKELPIINADVLNPAGLQLYHMSDDVRYVEKSIANVWQNLALGAMLATLILFLFMRSVKTTAVGVIGIPICIIMAFLGLLIAGRTINVISLAGIAFAIGMTLDNSIVVLESIALERRKHANRFAAAVAGVSQVWPAVLASTLTTVLVFLPVAFVQQEAGQLYSDIAIAISAAILASMLVAITILPTVCARLRPPHGEAGQAAASGRLVSNGHDGQGIHARTLEAIQQLLATPRRRATLIGLTVLGSLLIIALLTPPAEYLPEGEEPKIFASMNAPPGYNLAEMESIAADINEYLLPSVNADPDDFHRGRSAVPATAYINMRIAPDGLRIISEPLNPADIDELMRVITEKYLQYPGMRAFAARGSIITSNDGGTRSVNLDISGPDLAAIYNVALAAYRQAETVFDRPRIQTAPPSLTLAQPLIEVKPDWERLAEVELSAESLGFMVSALTDGSYVDEFFLADDKIDIFMYSTAGQTSSLDKLDTLIVFTPTSGPTPLSTLADFVETVDTSMIRRVNGRRTVTLNIIPPRDIPLETGVQMVREQVVKHLYNSAAVPQDVGIAISGAADQLDATREALVSNYLVALLIIYLLLVAILNHWAYPLLIMVSIPLGVSAGIVGLWLLNAAGGVLPILGLSAIIQPFDMISMLGFLILMGTVVNNPILVVHRAVSNFDRENMPALEAVQEAVAARLRPIAISTLTTVFGLAPLVLIPGAGTELYRGVGIIVMFGILGAALVTLTMLPALLVQVLEFKAARFQPKPEVE